MYQEKWLPRFQRDVCSLLVSRYGYIDSEAYDLIIKYKEVFRLLESDKGVSEYLVAGKIDRNKRYGE
ncbi:hypothetical protein [Paenibacillus odorifer]|uniref:Uncharacterized protein n=1 Tax=Paenibacillus odorifer TaxID=189426 RepID=A0AAD0P2F4_9BACL|nr:hypothetical protein [Paenibacillus odorifer]AWV34932.1 hypothetical protein CD191_21140 [Paenibacillus odorifer]